jgi:AcrR family transcriptional regulator
MEDVAREAGVSKGCAYYYFKSKTDLLYFVLSRFLNIVLKDLDQELEKINDPVEKIRHFIFRHVTIYAEHMFSAKALFNEGYNLPRPEMKKIKSMEKRYYAIIFDIISAYLGDRLDKDALTMVTFNLLGMCNWIYSWYNPQGPVDPEHFAQIIFDTFIGGASKSTA